MLPSGGIHLNCPVRSGSDFEITTHCINVPTTYRSASVNRRFVIVPLERAVLHTIQLILFSRR